MTESSDSAWEGSTRLASGRSGAFRGSASRNGRVRWSEASHSFEAQSPKASPQPDGSGLRDGKKSPWAQGWIYQPQACVGSFFVGSPPGQGDRGTVGEKNALIPPVEVERRNLSGRFPKSSPLERVGVPRKAS